MEESTLKRNSSCPDNQCAKAMRSTLILRPKSGSPLLLLFSEEDGCRLYSPEEDRVYETTRSDFSGYRILGNSGKWFLVVDSRSDLYIIDVFSEEKIHLPPLESMKGGYYKLERVADKELTCKLISESYRSGVVLTAMDLRGLLWVDDKSGNYVVVWKYVELGRQFLGYCKKGDDHYTEIPTAKLGDVRRELRGQRDLVLKGYSLYIFTSYDYIRHLDLSGQDGFKDVSETHRFPMWRDDYMNEELLGMTTISCRDTIVVTTSGEALIVHSRGYESNENFEKHRIFRVYKRDSKDLDPDTRDTRLVQVDSLGDEALFLDMGFTVPADHTLGIEPNSIYFTHDNRLRPDWRTPRFDICVYNLATKTTKRFPVLSNFNLKDARWFLP
ncbi:hypothetical protein EUTSA_v10010442mg [Eutrema salsugineum]|uniref:KIB1-4 beta-propeller domain-containing protein n=1 Tax=Eutrema salsugineum TaxID=72664 RepID=V4NHZ5_EUTSA|nr:F-box protein At5g25290 [Eutrema salsugineum]ESQ45836.1 hypothetical protein EUTSA_v10010442mg [Eutrema salsugineum]